MNPPNGFNRKLLFTIAILLLWIFNALIIFYYVPSDSTQGVVQRIFYIHVPTAWVSFIGFILNAWFSFQYLRSRNLIFDEKAKSYAYLSWVFTSGILITGPLWAKPVWGDYWNWADQRLVSFFILWLGYSAYIILRVSLTEAHKRARFAAVLALLSILNLPIVYFSIYIWQTPSHPQPVLKTGLNFEMRIALYYSFFCFLSLFFLLANALTTYFKQERQLAEKTSLKNI